jgi:hypothetical protein
MRRAATLAFLLLAVCAAPSGAMLRVPAQLEPVAANPAEKLLDQPIEDSTYDRATHCSSKRRKGMDALAKWLGAHARGVSWGTYRCEMWGKREASLHAEGRALDWHLDVSVPADKREAKRIILLLLAPDSAGNPQALARRMGVQELIWDCGYWAAGMSEFSKYAACFNKHGKARSKVDKTVAHRDHLHIGLTRAAAAGRTSFWTS